jgi:phosphate uptake regulator
MPKDWIRNFELDKDYKVDKNLTIAIDVRADGCLIINPRIREDESTEFEEITLNVSKSTPREIVKYSILGIDKIVIISDKEIGNDIIKDINFFINRLPDTYIFEKSPQRIEIRTFRIENLPIYQIIKKLLSLIVDMFENVRNSQSKKLESNFSELRKFYYTLVRHIRKFLRTGIYLSEDSDISPLEAMDLRMFCQKIERIGEILLNFRLTENIKNSFQIIETYFNEVMDAYLKKDFDSAYILWNKRNKIIMTFKEKYNTLDQINVENLKDLERIAHNCKDMTALI